MSTRLAVDQRSTRRILADDIVTCHAEDGKLRLLTFGNTSYSSIIAMRIPYILRSMAPREAVRVDLGLVRGIYLVVALAILMPALHSESWIVRAGMAKSLTIWIAYLPSLFLLIFLSARLGGDAVGDFGTGLLDLIFVTGLKPRQWLAVRVVQMWIGFLSVWVVRLPILACLFAVGGVGLDQIVVCEVLLLIAFQFLSGLSLLASFKAKSRQQVWSRLLLPMIVWELLMHAPAAIVGMLAAHFGLTIPVIVTNSLDSIAAIALSSQIGQTMWGPLEFAECLPTILLYAALSATILLRFLFRLKSASQGLVDAPVIDRSQKAEFRPAPRRNSRRCWDDALAWQAFCIHGYGKRLIQFKCVVYSIFSLALLVSMVSENIDIRLVFGVEAAIGLIALLIAVGKPSDCLSREIRDETMSTLMLTPNSTDDFFKGWQRGAWHLAWPDIVLATVLSLAGLTQNSYVPTITASLVLAVLFGGPFMMLSPLVPVTFKGIATGLGLTFVFVVIAGICIGVGAATHPIFVPLVLVPSAYLFNRFVRKYVLPYWMERKISTIV